MSIQGGERLLTASLHDGEFIESTTGLQNDSRPEIGENFFGTLEDRYRDTVFHVGDKSLTLTQARILFCPEKNIGDYSQEQRDEWTAKILNKNGAKIHADDVSSFNKHLGKIGEKPNYQVFETNSDEAVAFEKMQSKRFIEKTSNDVHTKSDTDKQLNNNAESAQKVILAVRAAAKPLVEKVILPVISEQINNSEKVAALEVDVTFAELIVTKPDSTPSDIKIIDIAPIAAHVEKKPVSDMRDSTMLRPIEQTEIILQPTIELIPEEILESEKTHTVPVTPWEMILDSKSEAMLESFSGKMSQDPAGQSIAGEIFNQAAVVDDYITPTSLEDTLKQSSIKTDESLPQSFVFHQDTVFIDLQPKVLIAELEESVMSTWQSELEMPTFTTVENITGEQVQVIELSQEYLTTNLVSFEVTGMNEGGKPVSMSEMILDQVREQVADLPENELQEAGLLVVEDIQQLTAEISQAVNNITTQVEQVYAEQAMPEGLQFMFENDQPVPIQKLIEQFASLDIETLPEQVVAVYYELLQKIVKLQEATEKLTGLFDIHYDVQSHQLIVLPKNTDPMHEKSAVYQQPTDVRSQFRSLIHMLAARTALTQSDVSLAA